MKNIYMLSDADILHCIAEKIKSLRLKQNISQQSLARDAGISLSSVVRAEEGNIKSLDTLIRILRMLGSLEIFTPLIEEEQLSPNEYYEFVNLSKRPRRKRAAKYVPRTEILEDPEW